MTRRKNAYQLLQIDQSTSIKAIRKAYNAWKKQRGAGGEEDKRKREQENEAYEILSHEAKRAKYDEALKMTRKKLLEKIEKHCFNTNGDPASINASDFEELDTEQLRRVYVIYDDTTSFKILEEMQDDAPDKPKGSCMEELTLMSMLKTHLNKDNEGRSPPWANPTSRKPLSQDLAHEILHRLSIRNTELFTAIDANDVERITYTLANGADANHIYVTASKVPLLNYAISKSANIDVIRALLENGAKANNSDLLGVTTLQCVQQYQHNKQELLELLKEHGSDATLQLIWAMKGKNAAGIPVLLEYGADVNGLVEGITPLMYAVRLSSALHIIEYLIKQGASVKKKSKNSVTPILGVPFYHGNRIELLNLLLKHGANINHRDDMGRDTLYLCIAHVNDSEMVQQLVENGINLTHTYKTQQNQRDHTILTWAIRHQRPRNILNMLVQKEPRLINTYGPRGPPIVMALAMQSVNLFKWCIDNGADTNIQDSESKKTLLMHTILNENREMIDATLSNSKTSMNVFDASGNTALHYATRVGDIGVVRSLVENKANINAKNSEGNTPLHVAVSYSKLDIAKYLIDQGANTLMKNTHGFMPLHLCLRPERQAVFSDLWNIYKASVARQNYDKRFVLIACQSHIPEILSELLQAGIEATEIDDNTGASCLIYAVSSMYDVDVLKELISRGANIHKVDYEGHNAIITAVLADHKDAFNFLLERGADIKLTDEDGSNILHLAAGVREVEIVKKLLEAGCDPNATNDTRNTPLILASDLLNRPVMKLLLEAGANPNIGNSQNYTAMHYIAEKADDPQAQVCLDLLLSYGAKVPENINQGVLNFSHVGGKKKPRKVTNVTRVR